MIVRGENESSNEGARKPSKNPKLFGQEIPEELLNGEHGEDHRRQLDKVSELVRLYEAATTNPSEDNLKAFVSAAKDVVNGPLDDAVTVIAAGIAATWIVQKMSGQ